MIYIIFMLLLLLFSIIDKFALVYLKNILNSFYLDIKH